MLKIGILGAGQLARMLALACYPLGVRALCLSPTSNACASQVTTTFITDFTDWKKLEKFAAEVDIITYETENIPIETIQFLEDKCPIYPPPLALYTAQDRLKEKTLFSTLGIPCAPYKEVDNLEQISSFLKDHQYPCILKTRKMGYDGKGQFQIKSHESLAPLEKQLKKGEYIIEKMINFERELSLICARDSKGELIFYPLVENIHHQGILQYSKAPFFDERLNKMAQEYAARILNYFNYVGVFTLELFQRGEHLLANEMAPRVHNSGHWTIEGAQTSQFENHLRAILNLPLGSVELYGNCYLFNLLGKEPSLEACLRIPGVHYHTYGKEPVVGRKLGHLTYIASDKIDCTEFLKTIKALIQ